MMAESENISAQESDRIERPDNFRRRVFIAVAIAVGVIIFLLFLYGTSHVLLLMFTAMLLAVFLRVPSHWLHNRTPLSNTLSLAIVTGAIVLLFVIFGFLTGPRLVNQADQLIDQIPTSVEQIESQLDRYEWGQEIIRQIPDDANLGQVFTDGRFNIFSRVTGIFSSSISLVGNLILLIFTAVFFALEPQTYINGIAELVPPHSRDRAKEVILSVGDTLAKWLLTRGISMVAIGIMTTIGLTVINVPLALSLGLIAGLMAFVPMIGPIIALVPAVLIGLLQSPQTALWVIVLYLAVQSIDNYVLTPIVVKQTIRMPPALIIFSQLIFGLLFGQLGLILAAPLAAATMTFTKMVYVRDFLERKQQDEEDSED